MTIEDTVDSMGISEEGEGGSTNFLDTGLRRSIQIAERCFNSPEYKINLEIEKKEREEAEELHKIKMANLETFFKGKNYNQKREHIFSVLAQHGKEYIDAFREKNQQPHPNEELSLLFSLAKQKGKRCKPISIPFGYERYRLYGFIFQTLYGQGTGFSVDSGNGKRLLTL